MPILCLGWKVLIEQDLSMRTEMTSCLSIAVLSVVVAAAPPTLSNLTWPLFHAVSKPFKARHYNVPSVPVRIGK